MATISACLIVKNEEAVLARCLDSLKAIVDEIIIVDTGSSDCTKKIAAAYTNQIYDFCWTGDFSEARNFSFQMAKMDYIYSADADEVIDVENQKKFNRLKESLIPEIEIVQMLYTNQLAFNTTYNFDKEYRPKLYKRLRSFYWQEPVHEFVRLEPIIYDSDIEIMHCPVGNHAARDFSIYLNVVRQRGELSAKLWMMYAKELLIAGQTSDFLDAEEHFRAYMENSCVKEEEFKRCQCILARCARMRGDKEAFFQCCLKNLAMDQSSSELCFELGEYYREAGDYKEATIWYYNAAYETEPELVLNYKSPLPFKKLSECYQLLGQTEEAEAYQQLADRAATEKEN